MRYPTKWKIEDLPAAVQEAECWQDVVGILGLSTSAAGNWRTVQKHSARLGLDTSHFRNTAQRRAGVSRRQSLDEILVDGIEYASYHLKKRLFNEGLKEKKCENCGLSEWLGLEVPFELDHINGIRTDNRIENLAILCPNCHSLTPTWRGRNRKAT